MKIEIFENEALIVENTPIIVDARNTNYIEVETPDDEATYSIKFVDEEGNAHTMGVKDGKVEIPVLLGKEGRISVTVYRADNEKIVPLFCAPLKVWRAGNTDALSYYIASGEMTSQLRNEHARIQALISSANRQIASLSNTISGLVVELGRVKKELAEFKTNYDENVEVMNKALEKIAELEERYDTLAV